MTTPDPSGLSGALLKLTEMAVRLALAEATMGGLGGAVTDLRALAEEHGRLLESVSTIVQALVPPADKKTEGGYSPRPSYHWWRLTEEERQREVERLGRWVEQVYRPWYGHQAAMLGNCWAEHPAVLIGLEILSELHSAVYFQPERTPALLNAQAEYQARILPALSEQFRKETSKCDHRQPASNGARWRGAQP